MDSIEVVLIMLLAVVASAYLMRLLPARSRCRWCRSRWAR
jgi:hypothetical protein